VLERHDLLGHFSVFSYSDEIGYRKPDAEIFRRTLAALGIEPEQAAHVGDNPVADVRGAQGVGMRGVHYASQGEPGAPHADLVVTNLGDLVERLRG
jgi:putative hydrolase of the HAD superfamily